MFFNTAFAAVQDAASDSQGGASDFFSSFVEMIPRFFAGVIVFVLAILFAKFLKKYITSRITARAKHEVNEEALILIERMVFFGVITLGLVISLAIVKINVVTFVSAIGLGLGFAFKDLLSNFIAGVVILTQKKFKIGDLVKVKDRIGTIVEIEARTTQIRDVDGTLLVIPNAEMLTEVVQNFTAHSFRRVSFRVGVHYSTPLEKALEIAMKAIKENKHVVIDPAPQVFFAEFDQSSINLEIRFWVESSIRNGWWIVQSEVIQAIKKEFDTAGIVIPFPITTLSLDSFDKNTKDGIRTISNK